MLREGEDGGHGGERRLRRWDEMRVVDKCRSNINVYVRNGNEERRREAAISELVDVVIITLITEIASNAPFMLYI